VLPSYATNKPIRLTNPLNVISETDKSVIRRLTSVNTNIKKRPKSQCNAASGDSLTGLNDAENFDPWKVLLTLTAQAASLRRWLQWTPDVTHLDVDRLELGVVVQRHSAVLSSDARLLVAAEGQFARIHVVVVNVDTAGLQCCHHAVSSTQITTTGHYRNKKDKKSK